MIVYPLSCELNKSQCKGVCGAGYGEGVIGRQMTKMRKRREREEERHKKPCAVMPYYHKRLHSAQACAKISFVGTFCWAKTSYWGTLHLFLRQGRGTKKHIKRSRFPVRVVQCMRSQWPVGWNTSFGLLVEMREQNFQISKMQINRV